jgi:hypothetical protein
MLKTVAQSLLAPKGASQDLIAKINSAGSPDRVTKRTDSIPSRRCIEGNQGLPGLMHKERTMGKHKLAFVAFDSAKEKHAVAIVDDGRDGEVRYLGETGNGHKS